MEKFDSSSYSQISKFLFVQTVDLSVQPHLFIHINKLMVTAPSVIFFTSHQTAL